MILNKCCNKQCGKVACCKCGYICGTKKDDEIMDYKFVDDIDSDVTDKVIEIFQKHDCNTIDNYEEKCQIIAETKILSDECTSEVLLCIECFQTNNN